MWNVQTESQWEFERNFNYLSYDALQLFFLKFPVLRLLYQFHSHALHEFFFFSFFYSIICDLLMQFESFFFLIHYPCEVEMGLYLFATFEEIK